MNEQNYASREASQRLTGAGIVLETDFHWVMRDDWRKETESGYCPEHMVIDEKQDEDEDAIPAPSMVEVWRELPDNGLIYINKHKDGASAWSAGGYDIKNANPTDALIDLLIWVRKEGKP